MRQSRRPNVRTTWNGWRKDLGTRTLDTNVTTKKYADDVDNLKLNKAGDRMSGDLDMVGHKIVKLDNPTDSKDASNKLYADNKVGEKISNVDVVDTSFTAGADSQI